MKFVARCLSGALILLCASAHAGGLDNIRFSRVGTETTIEIELGCSMSYVEHTPDAGGSELQVTMTIGQDCRLALLGVRSELRRPVAGRLAGLHEIEFEHEDRRRAFITLRFNNPVAFDVRQTGNRHMFTVLVDASKPAPLQDNATAPQVAETRQSSTPTPIPSNRAPGRRVQRPADPDQNRFAIRIALLSESESVDVDTLKLFDANILYTNEIVVGNRRWAELRVGFFDTEAEASAALKQLGPEYPSAWITIANAAEQVQARERIFRLPEAAPDPSTLATATEVPVRPERAFSDAEIDTMLIKAQGAYLSGDFAESIEIYTRLLEEPVGEYRRKARELLGVAYHKDGQYAQAQAEYEAYLVEFPDGADASRVRQRLATITVPVVENNAITAAAAPREPPPKWEFYGSASQYYLRGVNMGSDAEPDFIAQSALLSQANAFARYRGQRFEFVGRANGGYLYDFVKNGADDQALVSYAYVDILDSKYDVDVRVGRQSRHSGGVLGRFDGVHASYRLRPQLAINVTTGFPVDSPRFLPTSDVYFYGASVDLENVAGAWDFQVFTHLQMVEGIDDRKAFGAEAQYHKDGLNIVGLIDYDASYNVLNTGLITGNWRINDRLTLYGRFRGGAAPF